MNRSFALSIGAFVAAMIALLLSWRAGTGERDKSPVGEIRELAPAMGDMQRFTEKLYFASQAGNWPLAEFYLHEIEELTEAIIRSNIVDEGVPVSSFMQSMFPPAIKGLAAAVKARDVAQFAPRYEGLISSCNACHQSTQHGFVKIIVPRQPTYQNQDFAR